MTPVSLEMQAFWLYLHECGPMASTPPVAPKTDWGAFSCPILVRTNTRIEGLKMWSFVERAAHDVFRMTGHLEREHWIAVFAAALIVGAFMLRGFGTRI